MATPESLARAALRPHPAGVVISVKVVPGASRTEVVGLHGAALRVRVSAPADRGRANRAATDLLGRALGCRVDLLSGARSPLKRLLARDVDLETVAEQIASLSA